MDELFDAGSQKKKDKINRKECRKEAGETRTDDNREHRKKAELTNQRADSRGKNLK